MLFRFWSAERHSSFFLSLWREISGCGKVCLALSLRVSVYKGKRRKREWTTLPREKWEKLSVSTLSLSSRVESVAPFPCALLSICHGQSPSLYTHTHTAISPATSSSAVSERERKKKGNCTTPHRSNIHKIHYSPSIRQMLIQSLYADDVASNTGRCHSIG